MSAGSKLGNFSVNKTECEQRLKSVLNNTFMDRNILCKDVPWFIPKKSRKKTNSLQIIKFVYMLLETTQEHGHYAYKKDWVRDINTGDLVFVNKDVLALYATVAKQQMKKIMSKLIRGGNVMRISLPIVIFSNVS